MVNPRFTPPFSLTQQKVLAIVPKVTAVPSILGAASIMRDVLRKKKWRVYHRIMLAMSAMDFLYAVKCFVSTWIIPEELQIWGALGSTRTCDAFGFLGHGSSLSSVIYNGSLAIYFVLTIAYNWRESAIRKSGLEFMLHAVPLTVGWTTAIASLVMELNNPIGWTCWIGTYPPGCGLPAPWSPPCERGSVKAVDVHRWALFHVLLWFVFCLCTISMIILVVKVRQQEKSMERYVFRTGSDSSSSMERRQRDLSQKVAVQATLYIAFFFLTWIFPMVQFVVANRTGYLLFPMLLLTVIFNPLQGFYDAVIYFRPRYLQYRKQQAAQQATMDGVSGLPFSCDRHSRLESLAHALKSNDVEAEVEGEIMPETPFPKLDTRAEGTNNTRSSSSPEPAENHGTS